MAVKQMEVQKRAGFSVAVLPMPDFSWKKYRIEGGSPKYRKAVIEIRWKKDCQAILANAVWQ